MGMLLFLKKSMIFVLTVNYDAVLVLIYKCRCD